MAEQLLRTIDAGDQKRQYPKWVLDKISSMRDAINHYSGKYDVPSLAVAGSIADEYETRGNHLGLKGLADGIQDYAVPRTGSHGWLPRTEIGGGNYPLAGEVPAYVDSPGFLRADVGAGNIGMRTAEYLYDRYRGEFPQRVKDPLSLARYAVSDEGNAHLAALYIKEAHDRLGTILAGSEAPLPPDYMTALSVDYFRDGPERLIDNYAGRIGQDKARDYIQGRKSIPVEDLPLPYHGVHVLNNAPGLRHALGDRARDCTKSARKSIGALQRHRSGALSCPHRNRSEA